VRWRVWDAEQSKLPRARCRFAFLVTDALMFMRYRVHHRLGSAVVCGLLCVLAFQSVGGSRVRASCGDWLAHPGETPMSATNAVTSEAQITSETTSAVHSSGTRLPQSKPCNGPYCRSAPFHSTPTSPVSVSWPTDRLAVYGYAELQLAICSQFHRACEPHAFPAPGFKARIEHPPRV
jgi:hypothetical protein